MFSFSHGRTQKGTEGRKVEESFEVHVASSFIPLFYATLLFFRVPTVCFRGFSPPGDMFFDGSIDEPFELGLVPSEVN